MCINLYGKIVPRVCRCTSETHCSLACIVKYAGAYYMSEYVYKYKNVTYNIYICSHHYRCHCSINFTSFSIVLKIYNSLVVVRERERGTIQTLLPKIHGILPFCMSNATLPCSYYCLALLTHF